MASAPEAERTVLRAVVAEDEPLVREMLLEMLQELAGVEVVASCKNGLEAVQAVQTQRPDLLFLDVEMPKLNGFEVLELLEEKPAVIFVTAFDGYAVRAFEAEAVDYLLKPFSLERIAEAVERVARRSGLSLAPRQPASAQSQPNYLQQIAVKDGPWVAVIPAGELRWARSEDDYVRLGTASRQWLKHQSLSALEQQLDPLRFVRIHRTCIVNVMCVVRVDAETRDRFVVQLDDGTTVPASRQGQKRLRDVLGI